MDTYLSPISFRDAQLECHAFRALGRRLRLLSRGLSLPDPWIIQYRSRSQTAAAAPPQYAEAYGPSRSAKDDTADGSRDSSIRSFISRRTVLRAGPHRFFSGPPITILCHSLPVDNQLPNVLHQRLNHAPLLRHPPSLAPTAPAPSGSLSGSLPAAQGG